MAPTDLGNADDAVGTSTDAPMSTDVAAADVVPEDVVDPDAGYPPEPHGPAVGDTLPNFTFMGYWAPTQTTGLSNTQPFEEITMDRIRRSGARFLLMELGAFW